jgi:hypothetical protein
LVLASSLGLSGASARPEDAVNFPTQWPNITENGN